MKQQRQRPLTYLYYYIYYKHINTHVMNNSAKNTTEVKPMDAKKALVAKWKKDNFSLSAVTKYLVSEYVAGNEFVKHFFAPHKGLNSELSKKDVSKVITLKYVQKALGERGLTRWSKDPETGKMTVPNGPKINFTLWSVLTAIGAYERNKDNDSKTTATK